MINEELKDYLTRHVLSEVQMPAQYLGGELNMVRKDHREVRGRLCLAFPDLYTIGMSHHGLQILYSLMNAREDWACERVFAPVVGHGGRVAQAQAATLQPRDIHAARPV